MNLTPIDADQFTRGRFLRFIYFMATIDFYVYFCIALGDMLTPFTLLIFALFIHVAFVGTL